MVICVRVVVPVANAVTCLPGQLHHLIGSSTLHIPCEGFFLFLIENLSKDYGSWIPVIQMSNNLQATVTERIEWQYSHIEVNKIWIVAVYGIKCPIIEVGYKLLGWRTGTMTPIPLTMDGSIVPRSLAHRMILAVEHLWIKSFPPLAFTVFFSQVTIIKDTSFRTFQVVALCRFEPRPCMVSMERDAQRQPLLFGCCSPFSQDVTLGPNVLRVPRLVLRIPQVVVVVVIAQDKEILRTTAFIAGHKAVRLPVLSFEQRKDILIPKL